MHCMHALFFCLVLSLVCVCACMTRHALHAFKQARPAECTHASSTCAVYLNILNTRASTALHAIPYGHCTPVPVQHSTCPELRSTTDLTRSVWDTTIGIAKYRNVTGLMKQARDEKYTREERALFFGFRTVCKLLIR